MASDRNNLESYAVRWLDLANYELVRNDSPYFIAFDRLADEYRAAGTLGSGGLLELD